MTTYNLVVSTEKLQKLADHKLVDVVRNYRQYGYDEQTRMAALEILQSRNVDVESLKLGGAFENKSYEDAEWYFQAFEKQSKAAFVLYGLSLVFKVVVPMVMYTSPTFQVILLLASFLSVIAYLVMLIKSFLSQMKYYEIIGNREMQLSPGLYFSIGMLFYIVMYFVFRKQVKEDIRMIR